MIQTFLELDILIKWAVCIAIFNFVTLTGCLLISKYFLKVPEWHYYPMSFISFSEALFVLGFVGVGNSIIDSRLAFVLREFGLATLVLIFMYKSWKGEKFKSLKKYDNIHKIKN